MEIMIKTKQSSNPLFEFLNIDNILYPYYKHMIKMIKSGKYKPKVDNESDDEGKLAVGKSLFSLFFFFYFVLLGLSFSLILIS